MNLLALAAKHETAAAYFRLRSERPDVPAKLAFDYVTGAEQPLAEFVCERTTGHRWAYTGTAYGGDDDRYMGEGRCYCLHCGADGDA